MKLKKRKEVSILCQNVITRWRFCKRLCTKLSNWVNLDKWVRVIFFSFLFTLHFSMSHKMLWRLLSGLFSSKRRLTFLRYYKSEWCEKLLNLAFLSVELFYECLDEFIEGAFSGCFFASSWRKAWSIFLFVLLKNSVLKSHWYNCLLIFRKKKSRSKLRLIWKF